MAESLEVVSGMDALWLVEHKMDLDFQGSIAVEWAVADIYSKTKNQLLPTTYNDQGYYLMLGIPLRYDDASFFIIY